MKKMILNSSGGGITAPLDSNYFKGQGLRQGIEREYIIEIIGDDSRSSDPEDSDGGGEIAFTQNSRDYKGVMVVVISEDNRSADGEYPFRSYSGQDAYNDMFVTEKKNERMHRERTTQSDVYGREDRFSELHARPADNNAGGGDGKDYRKKAHTIGM